MPLNFTYIIIYTTYINFSNKKHFVYPKYFTIYTCTKVVLFYIILTKYDKTQLSINTFYNQLPGLIVAFDYTLTVHSINLYNQSNYMINCDIITMYKTFENILFGLNIVLTRAYSYVYINNIILYIICRACNVPTLYQKMFCHVRLLLSKIKLFELTNSLSYNYYKSCTNVCKQQLTSPCHKMFETIIVALIATLKKTFNLNYSSYNHIYRSERWVCTAHTTQQRASYNAYRFVVKLLLFNLCILCPVLEFINTILLISINELLTNQSNGG